MFAVTFIFVTKPSATLTRLESSSSGVQAGTKDFMSWDIQEDSQDYEEQHC